MNVRTERRRLTIPERDRGAALIVRERPRWLGVAATGIFLVVAAGFLTPCLAGAAIMLLDGLGLHVDGDTTLRIVATAAFLVLGWNAWSIFALVHRKQLLIAAIERDLAEGVAEVLHVESSAARRPANDFVDAPTFLHDVGDGSFLFTHGPHLKPLVEAKKFPCRAFALVRLPTAKLTLEVVPSGELLEPTAVVLPSDSLQDGDVVKLP